MTFDKDRTAAFMAQNYPVICATCVKLPKGINRGLGGCGVSTCGGPMHRSGPRAFPDYDGPIPSESLSTICLKCGHSKIARQVVIGERRLGLCESHKGIFDKMKFEVVQSGKRKGFVKPTNASKLLMIEV